MSSNYQQISASTQIKPAAGKLKGIFVSSASNNPTITVYDSFSASTGDPKIIDTFALTGATNYNFFDGIYANKGIYVVIAGTVSCTVSFE